MCIFAKRLLNYQYLIKKDNYKINIKHGTKKHTRQQLQIL